MDNLDFASLSEREAEILELAIDGLTDQQIGNRINISASTVNSYWVRIRGKLGHLSRTDLVSRVLQQRALRENDLLRNRIRELEAEAIVNRRSEWNTENADLLRAAFESLPEPVFIIDSNGCILFASERAETLFGYGRQELDGASVYEFIKSGDDHGVVLTEARTGSHRHGVDTVVYGREKDGRLFRAILLTASREVLGRTVFSCIVRPFTEEVDLLRRRASVVLGSL